MTLSQLLFIASIIACIVGSICFLALIVYVVVSFILRRLAEWRELKAYALRSQQHENEIKILLIKYQRLEEKQDEKRSESVVSHQHVEEELAALRQELVSLKTKRKETSIAKGRKDKPDYFKSIKPRQNNH